jgi:hypothetical protein
MTMPPSRSSRRHRLVWRPTSAGRGRESLGAGRELAPWAGGAKCGGTRHRPAALKRVPGWALPGRPELQTPSGEKVTTPPWGQLRGQCGSEGVVYGRLRSLSGGGSRETVRPLSFNATQAVNGSTGRQRSCALRVGTARARARNSTRRRAMSCPFANPAELCDDWLAHLDATLAHRWSRRMRSCRYGGDLRVWHDRARGRATVLR